MELKLKAVTVDGITISFVEEIRLTRDSLLQECLDPGDNLPLSRPPYLHKFVRIAEAVKEANDSRFGKDS